MLNKISKLSPSQIKTEALSGLTVALALVPEAIAFAFVAGVHPLIGLYAAFIVGLITSAFGGRPGMISGATGALAVIMVSLVASHGIEYLFAAVVLMGIIQITIGALKFGKFIRIVPHPAMLGFVNGLAIVIFLSQLNQFKITNEAGESAWLQGEQLYIMLGLVALTMAIIQFLPKLTKAVPPALGAIFIIFGINEFLDLDTRNVGDMASIAGGLPKFHIPDVDINLDMLMVILPYSILMCLVGLIESLLALTLIDEITETHGRNSRECMAQGAANVVTGFFGGMGGCAMIGQSMINITSGARHRLSGILAALFLLGFIIFGSGLIEKIPLAALTGVMFMVVIGTFAWRSITIIRKIPKSDAFVVLAVTIITVFFDLAIAVIIGVIISALVYAWQSSQHITAVIKIDEKKNLKTYELYGPIFFGSVLSFRDLFDPKKDPENIVVNFEYARVWDHSGIEAIKKLARRYQLAGKNITFIRLSTDCAKLMERVGNVIQVDKEYDPKYNVVMDRDWEPGSH